MGIYAPPYVTAQLVHEAKGADGEEEQSSLLIDSKMGRSLGIWGARVK
jgi:hypothetical protein